MVRSRAPSVTDAVLRNLSGNSLEGIMENQSRPAFAPEMRVISGPVKMIFALVSVCTTQVRTNLFRFCSRSGVKAAGDGNRLPCQAESQLATNFWLRGANPMRSMAALVALR